VTIRDEGSDILRFADSAEGRLAGVALDVDADAFSDLWLASVEAAARRAPSPPA
jgi:hypothetical protein